MSRSHEKKILGKLVDDGFRKETRTATISVRPLKVAFLLNREVGIEGLRKIIQYNSSVWSGIHNPIIPTDGLDITDYWLYSLIQYDPDILIQVGEFDSEGFQALHDKIQPFNSLIWEDSLLEPKNWKFKNPGGISIHFCYDYLRQKHNPLSPSAPPFGVASSQPQDSNRLLIEAQFGLLPDRLDNFLEAELAASRIRFPKDQFHEYLRNIKEFRNRVSPLGITGYQIDRHYYGSDFVCNLIIAQTRSIDDVCVYWNLRSGSGSLGTEVHIVPYEPLQDEAGVNSLANWCNQTIMHSNTVQICSTSVAKEELGDIKQRLKPRLQGKLSRVDIRFSNFKIPRFRLHALEKQERVEIDDNVVTFTPPRIPWLENPRKMLFAVDFSFERVHYNKKGFWPPTYPGLNQFLCKNSKVATGFIHGHRFRMASERLSCLENEYRDFKQVFLPDDEETFPRFLEHYGLKSEVSDKCRYIRRIINLFGELQDMHPLRSGKWRDVFEAIQEDSLDLDQMGRVYKPQGDQANFLDTTMEFAHKNIFLRGHKLRCPSCGYKHWYPAEMTREVMHCVGCRASVQMPLECPFSYKLNELVKRGVEQGMIPVVLTMLYLYELCDTSFHCLPGVEVTDSNGVKQDLDILASCDGHLVAAECKTLRNCEDKSREDVERQIEKMAKLADGICAKAFLFAALFQSPPRDLRDLTARLGGEYMNKMNIHVLDLSHLEYEGRYQDLEGRDKHSLNRYIPDQNMDWREGEIRDEGGVEVSM